MRNVLDKFVEEIATHILYSVLFFLKKKSCILWDNVGKRRAGQALDDYMAYARCMLHNKGYTHTHTQNM